MAYRYAIDRFIAEVARRLTFRIALDSNFPFPISQTIFNLDL